MRVEDKLAQEVSDYIAIQYPKVIAHFDTGSGGRTTIGMAMRNKRLNKKNGYPDLFIAERGYIRESDGLIISSYMGLFIELKVKSPYLKDGKTLRADNHIHEQAEMLAKLVGKGYKAVFGVGFDHCKEIIDDYLT